MGHPLRERREASEAVADVIASARGRRGGVLLVEGEAGLGKTTILESARRLAEPELRVGVGRGDTMETSLPFGVLDQALGALSGPILGMGPTVATARAEQLFRLLRWFESLDQGVVLLLDDLHWADSDSLELVSLLCRRIGSLPVAVVATLRPWPDQAHEVSRRLTTDGAARLARLAPLSRAGSRAMLEERSGRAVSGGAAVRAWELCGGNPLLLEQLALAIGRGTIDAETAEAWPAVEPDGWLLSRFAGLPTEALRCVRAASVLGVRFRPAHAAAVAGLSDLDADHAIEALCRSGLVQQGTSELVRFVHPLFAQALYDDLPRPVRARLHWRSFEVLTSSGLDAEAAAHALLADRPDAPEVIAALERAGVAALGVGALGTAAAQLKTAVDLAGQRASTTLLLAQAEAQLGAGDPTASARSFERALSRGGLAPAARASALRMRGRALYAGGDYETAMVSFSEATDLLLAHDPLAAAEALVDQALSMHIVLGPRGCLPMAERAIELTAGTDRALRHRADAALGYLSVIRGDPAGLAATARAAVTAAADPRPELVDPAWAWGVTSVHAHASKYLEHFDEAARGFRSVRVAAERLGAAEALTMSLIGEAEVAMRTGQLRHALALSDRASELTALVPLGAAQNAVVRFFTLLHLDRAADAASCCAELEQLLDERDEGISRIWLLHLQGITHLGLGRPEAASDVYLRAEQRCDQLGIGEPCVVPWAGRAVIAHARAGRDADAARVLAWLDACASRLPCRYPLVAAAFGRAELATWHADHRSAEHHYRSALELHGDARLPMERTSTLLSYGNLLRRTGRMTDARRILAEALETAEAIGAPALARYAREDLSSAGGRRRRRTPDGHLTPQELRIARMIREGESRRDVAARLTLSEATVRSHLEHIYAKLNIHSARELMTCTLDQLTEHRGQPASPPTDRR